MFSFYLLGGLALVVAGLTLLAAALSVQARQRLDTLARQTIVLGVLGAVLLGAAALTRTGRTQATVDADVGTELFPDFTDPWAATSLTITEYDPTSVQLKQLRIAFQDGRWSLPSHENYPADAKQQLADAASSVMRLKKLDVAGETRELHELFGVVDPDQIDEFGTEGVGKKVVFEDAQGKKLAHFIFGKSDADRPGIRFVRVPGQDRVYRIEADTFRLSTRFADWIEPDLLKLSTFDVKQVEVHNHSIDVDLRRGRPRLLQKGDFVLSYDNATRGWTLVSSKSPVPGSGQLVPGPALTPEQELDKAKLDDMLSALGALRIVDVTHKPAGIGGDLKVDEKLASDEAAVESLARRGFYVAELGAGPDGKPLVGLFSNEGEVVLSLSTGVEYVLRFGNITRRGGEGEAEAAAKEQQDRKTTDAGPGGAAPPAGTGPEGTAPTPPADKPAEESSQGSNRYLLVSVRFNPDLIPKPELKPEPPAPAGPAAAAPAPAAPTGTAAPPAGTAPASAPPAGTVPNDPHAAERARIREENQKLTEEYDRKLAEGKKKAEELAARFAPWYYVIADSTFKRLSLNLPALIKAKEPDPSAGAAGDPAGAPPMGTAAPQDPLEEFNELRKGIAP